MKSASMSAKFSIPLITPDSLQWIKFLGQGGCGKVYKCNYRTATENLSVAVKVCNKKSKYFFKELQALAKVSRAQNITRLYGYGYSGTHIPGTLSRKFYIVTEFVSRGSLSSIVADPTERLDWPIILKIARDIALGLAELHKEGIIHCDIKLENIFIDKHFNVRIGDLDCANSAGGTSFYMAPEILLYEVETPSCATDMHSLGMTFLELFNMRKFNELIAFQDKFDSLLRWRSWYGYSDKAEKAIMRVATEIDSKIDFPENYLKGFQKIIMACVSRDPAKRPTATQVVVQLNALLVGAPESQPKRLSVITLDKLQAREELKWLEILTIAVDVITELCFFHQQNKLPMVITPRSILISIAHPAKIDDTLITLENELECNPNYFSPEFKETREVSSASNIYSFGMLLIELADKDACDKLHFTKQPFTVDDLLSEMVRPKDCLSGHFAAYKAIIDNCLHHNPEDRLTADTIKKRLHDLILKCATFEKQRKLSASSTDIKPLIANSMFAPEKSDTKLAKQSIVTTHIVKRLHGG